MIQLVLIFAQLMVEAAAFLAVAIGVQSPLDYQTALGLRSVVEWTTYLPVPLSGLGVHHAGITETVALFGAQSARLGAQAVVHHGLWFVSSVVVGLMAWAVIEAARDEA